VAYSPDGRLLATGSGVGLSDSGGEVRLWDPAPGKELPGALTDLPGRAISLAFSADGKRLAVGVGTLKVGYVLLWDTEARKEALRFRTGNIVPREVAFSPEGRLIFSVGELGKEVRVWEANTGKLRAELKPHASMLVGAAYSPDGRR
jgi:WD40 repeat protein